ncbi:MAG: hypothetical protein HY699_18845 [Deltaproteobacteria bacterium]|nr:hypothetical protein [Deltaproteobacteria bacterium]
MQAAAGSWAVVMAASVLIASAPAPSGARDKLCAQIRKAITAGRTVDEVAREFDADAVRIGDCMQQPGKLRKPAKEKPGTSKAKRARGRAGTVQRSDAGSAGHAGRSKAKSRRASGKKPAKQRSAARR